MKKQKKIKVYIVGTHTSYASWLNCELVYDMNEADLVLFTGGEDVNPMMYNQKVGKLTHFNKKRDEFEMQEAMKAIHLGKNIFGTCRGAQLGCVMSGGLLIQHMNHPYIHPMKMYDGTVIQTNSLHHQLQQPFNLPPTDYIIAGWAKGLSNIYLNGNNDNTILPSRKQGNDDYIKEPELVYYRKTKWLGIQGHPEMMDYASPLCNMLRRMVDLMLDDKLDLVLTMEIPIDEYIDKELVVSEDIIRMYDQLLEKRKVSSINVMSVN